VGSRLLVGAPFDDTRGLDAGAAYLFEENNFADLERDLGRIDGPVPFGHAVAHAAADLAKQINAKAILSLSNTGMSAVTISSARPSAPLLAISADPKTYRRLNLQWGTLPVLAEDAGHAHPNQLARRIALQSSLPDLNRLLLPYDELPQTFTILLFLLIEDYANVARQSLSFRSLDRASLEFS